jgi:peroxiredoxin
MGRSRVLYFAPLRPAFGPLRFVRGRAHFPVRSPRHLHRLLAAALLAVSCASGAPLQAQKVPKQAPREGRQQGDIAFDFTLKDLDGKPHKLSDLRGHVVQVVFWATWCMPCLDEVPDLKAAYARYHDKGFEILGIVVPMSQTPEGVRAFVAKQEMHYPVLWDEGMTLMNRYRVDSIPRNFLIDRDGIIRYAGVSLPANYEEFIQYSLLKSPAPPAGAS